MNRLLVFCSEASGGLADYAHAQCEALAQQSLHVTLLAPADFIHHSSLYTLRADLAPTTPPTSWPVLLRRFYFPFRLLANSRASQRFIKRFNYQFVLWNSFTEYLAPLWAWRFRRLRRLGVCFAAVVHDPVRSFRVGPLWWHRLSIAEGYSFLSHAFVHAPIVLETFRYNPSLRTTQIPHGPFLFPVDATSGEEMRASLGISEDSPLLLAFGRLRTDKNLDLVLHAVAQHPTAHLLVAGPEATPGQLQSSDYRSIALRLGISQRCHWLIHFHSDADISAVFTAADAVVLAYSASFRSASGVLNVAANYKLPLLVSAGDGALLTAVRRYSLGVVVTPDESDALATGLEQLLENPAPTNWTAYLEENSWEINANRVIEAMGLGSSFSGSTFPP